MRADELEVFQWKRSLEQFYGNKRAATPDVTYKDCFAEVRTESRSVMVCICVMDSRRHTGVCGASHVILITVL